MVLQYTVALSSTPSCNCAFFNNKTLYITKTELFGHIFFIVCQE